VKVELASLTKESGGLTASEIRTLLGRDDPVVLEIGANVGDTTLEILRVMPNAKIFAFEPDPRAIEIFKASVSSENVHLIECAVGDRNGTTSFHQSTGKGRFKDWNASGSIRKPKTHLEIWPEVKFETDITVPIIRLDDWANELNIDRIDFIWTDAQGAESDIVAGGLNTINKARFFYTATTSGMTDKSIWKPYTRHWKIFPFCDFLIWTSCLRTCTRQTISPQWSHHLTPLPLHRKSTD
jgi:2-O-methyltransferase